jgi:hypothetical protein
MVYRKLDKINIFLVLIFFIGVSCTKKTSPTSNPLDPDTDDYVPPMVAIQSSVPSGSVVDASQITVELMGNDLVVEFRYRLDDFAWADWNESPIIILDYLDEGGHSIQFQSRYLSGDESDITSLDFTVDAVLGPSIMFYPRRAFAENNEIVNFEILAEEVENLAGFEFYVEFDQDKIQLEEITPGTVFTENGEPIFLTEQTSSGGLRITSAVWGQDTPAFNGTGSLAILSFKMLQNSDVHITFEGNQIFRNSSNSSINIQEIISGYITQ